MSGRIDGTNPLRPRLGVVVSTWSHEDGQEFAANLPQLFPSTAPQHKVELITCPKLLEYEKDIAEIVGFFHDKDIDALCLIPGNFTLDQVLPLMAQGIDLPTILWGLPTMEAWGALVCVQQTLYVFKELGLPYCYVVANLGDDRAWETILSYARGAALMRRLKGLRVGIVGWRAQGMSDMTFDELALREIFGVQVVNVGLTRYTRAIDTVPGPEVDQLWDQLKPGFDTTNVSDDVARYGVRSYVALKRLVSEDALQAMTIECFHDHLGGPCLGCSLLNDQGIAAACESDVPGAVLMAAGQLLSGEPTFHVDIITADLAGNSAILHHCGNLPRRLAADLNKVALRAIPEHIGPGAYGPTVQASMRPGPITLANLVGRRGNMRISIMEAMVVPYELEFPGSAAKAVFPFDLAQGLQDLGRWGSGHHFVVIDGHVANDLARWSELVGIHSLRVNEND